MNTLSELRDLIVQSFNLEDLRDLCFEMNIDYEQLAGETIGAKARELLLFCQRHGRLELLLERCRELRPHLDWQSATADSPAEAGGFPPMLAQAGFEYKIALVTHRLRQLFARTIDAGAILPVADLLSELRALFIRNTYDESIELCQDQNWHDRMCAAVQTDYFLLGCWPLVKDGARQLGEPVWLESYETVQQENRGYCQALSALFEPTVTVAAVNRRFLSGQLESIRSLLKERRVRRGDGLDSGVIARCEARRLAIREQIDTWPAF